MSQMDQPIFGQPLSSSIADMTRVLWTRGEQCRALAHVLGGDDANQAESDLVASCIETKARILVARRLTSFDLCNVAVPHGFDPVATTSVVAAVGSGPHSVFAAVLAQHLAHRLDVPSVAVYGYQSASEQQQARDVLAGIAEQVPNLDTRPVQTASPAAMVTALKKGTLVVVGAPGGSWFQRQFFGPGIRIQTKAPGGTIVVRHAPTRVYQVMQDTPVAFGPHMRVRDALRLANARNVIVAEHGALIGLVRLQTLVEAAPTQELQDVMDAPVFLYADEHLDHTRDLISHDPGASIPVLDARDEMVGMITADELGPRSVT